MKLAVKLAFVWLGIIVVAVIGMTIAFLVCFPKPTLLVIGLFLIAILTTISILTLAEWDIRRNL